MSTGLVLTAIAFTVIGCFIMARSQFWRYQSHDNLMWINLKIFIGGLTLLIGGLYGIVEVITQ